MPGQFLSPEGDLELIFVTDYGMIDQFVATGSLWMMGGNDHGQLGVNDSVTPRSSPIQTIAYGTNWKSVECGYYHTATIKTDGTLWSWGRNNNGQLGVNDATDRSSPIQTVAYGTNWKSVSSGAYHTIAIKSDGTLWLWGRNDQGQLGDNSISNRSSPVQTVTYGTNWKQASGGVYHTSAIKTDGTLWSWGYNLYGNLGDNTTTNTSSPVQTIAYGTNWKQVACGFYHTAAIKTDGTLWSWGYNPYGNLGDNTITDRSSPVQTITYGNTWKSVDCGGYFTASIKTDGTLWLWGYNGFGQLADNTITDRSSPVQTVAYGTNWKQVSGGDISGMAVKTDGTLWTWGYNASGQLGDNTRTRKSSPVQTISYGNNWKQASMGGIMGSAIYFSNALNDFPSINN